jgi:flagellar biosynthesis/type III secretory pathway M-ring protein FliF/YscJ
MYTYPEGVFEGENVQAALKKAAVDLGVAEEDIEVTVLESGFGGVFGFMQSNSKISAKATKFGQRDAQEIARYLKLAQSVVGYDPTRGDRVEIIQSPFRNVMVDKAVPMHEQSWVETTQPYWAVMIFGILALVSLLILARPLSSYLQTATVRVKDLEQQLEQQLAEAEAAPELTAPDNLQLGPPDQTDESLALVESEENVLSDEDKKESSLMLAELEDLSAQDGSIDARLMGVLDVVGEASEWDNKLEVNRRSALLEKTIRELAQEHPESLAEALTFWMNDRHA